ncbi:hypothetical protein EPD60_06285 [Flaviaesturariibacter flavus]|uniref:DUF4136 domain-containing protein n=1 Tax=Flaviaesturariibacter flavus TaxID=2502780 RepID=A0A4R1BKA0_9BACT|nr:hypothetical protein [Flaviaesturariibacter flavus]TCJ17791.1 hypothetical protein EPD60_06285 [Flaviaesturariibacter flavus]
MKNLFAFLLLLPLCLHAQEPAQPGAGAPRTVAIRSAKRSFFPDFTIDSLVGQLNRLNRNPGIRFCRSTEDDSPTGFYADYLVDVDFDVRFAHLEAPPPSEARLRYLQQPATKQSNNAVTTTANSMAYLPEPRADFKMKTGEGVCTVKILERRANEKIKREYLRAASDNDDALRYQLAAAAINYLVQRFAK